MVIVRSIYSIAGSGTGVVVALVHATTMNEYGNRVMKWIANSQYLVQRRTYGALQRKLLQLPEIPCQLLECVLMSGNFDTDSANNVFRFSKESLFSVSNLIRWKVSAILSVNFLCGSSEHHISIFLSVYRELSSVLAAQHFNIFKFVLNWLKWTSWSAARDLRWLDLMSRKYSDEN